jgi:hypothetical protein
VKGEEDGLGKPTVWAVPLLFSAPFFFSGGLKIIYGLFLYRSFRGKKPQEESELRN